MRSNWLILRVLIVVWFSSVKALELAILHTNDLHARFEETNKYSGRCSDEDKLEEKCYGGVARIATKVKELRSLHSNVLLLDGGDQFQGTLWFYNYKGKAASHFMNRIGYDAMALGNHEFDNEVEGLIPFLENVSFPVLSCNINTTYEADIEGLFVKSTTIAVPTGDKIGIVGYTTEDTPIISNSGNLIFESVIDCVQKEVDKLKSQGINKIVALGHAGIDKDIEIADQVAGVDIVIGGHTNTFLYTGDAPGHETPFGEYPLVRRHDDGRSVLVMQAYAYGKYLGYLNVTFDSDGEITEYQGNPILLDKNVEKDNSTATEVNLWAEPIQALSSEYVGKTHVFLDGRRESCRLVECNLGNLIADAMVHQNIKHPDGVKWNDVSIAIMNSGGIRTSLHSDEGGAGSISVGDILNVQPFRNTLDIIEITGKTLRKALEHSVSAYTPEDPEHADGRFLQYSGLLVTYDTSKPIGKRVVKVEVKCTECAVPEYRPLQSNALYKVILPTYVAEGGDDYEMLLSERVSYHIPGDLDTDVLIEYIKRESPITIGLERRITIIDDKTDLPMCRENINVAAMARISMWCLFAALSLTIVLVESRSF
ncbi:snake venom 5'-nucleotidase-like [Glandiceps talaboti]